MPATMLQVKVIQSMTEVDRESWDTLVGDGSPFLEWDWLAAMERARCVTAKTGWQPQHPSRRCLPSVPQGPQHGRVRFRSLVG